jgi:hypothetical protein
MPAEIAFYGEIYHTVGKRVRAGTYFFAPGLGGVWPDAIRLLV